MKEKFKLVEAKIIDGKADSNGDIKQFGILVVKSGLAKVELFAPVKKVAQLKTYLSDNDGVAEIEVTFELELRSTQAGKQFFAAVATEFEIVG